MKLALVDLDTSNTSDEGATSKVEKDQSACGVIGPSEMYDSWVRGLNGFYSFSVVWRGLVESRATSNLSCVQVAKKQDVSAAAFASVLEAMSEGISILRSETGELEQQQTFSVVQTGDARLFRTLKARGCGC